MLYITYVLYLKKNDINALNSDAKLNENKGEASRHMGHHGTRWQCKCMAGLDECCSHVAALLFTLESATRGRSEALVSDEPAYWMFPSGPRLDTSYTRFKDMEFQSATRKMSMTESDCQPPVNNVEEVLDMIPSPTKHKENNFLDELAKCLPKSAVLSLSDKFRTALFQRLNLKAGLGT